MFCQHSSVREILWQVRHKLALNTENSCGALLGHHGANDPDIFSLHYLFWCLCNNVKNVNIADEDQAIEFIKRALEITINQSVKSIDDWTMRTLDLIKLVRFYFKRSLMRAKLKIHATHEFCIDFNYKEKHAFTLNYNTWFFFAGTYFICEKCCLIVGVFSSVDHCIFCTLWNGILKPLFLKRYLLSTIYFDVIKDCIANFYFPMWSWESHHRRFLNKVWVFCNAFQKLLVSPIK